MLRLSLSYKEIRIPSCRNWVNTTDCVKRLFTGHFILQIGVLIFEDELDIIKENKSNCCYVGWEGNACRTETTATPFVFCLMGTDANKWKGISRQNKTRMVDFSSYRNRHGIPPSNWRQFYAWFAVSWDAIPLKSPRLLLYSSTVSKNHVLEFPHLS